MISDLDLTLEELLRRELPASLVSQVGISFAAPDNQFPPSTVTLPAIDLFLYDVRENRDLRETAPLIERQDDGTALVTRPPVRVDCSYLVTAWSSETSPQRTQDEHRILSEVMLALLRHRTLPAQILQGALADQDLPPPTSVLHPGQLQSLGELWHALGGKPKAALHYTATIAVAVAPAEQAAPPVTDRRLRVSQFAAG